METRLGAFYDTIFGSIDFCRIMVYDEEKCIVWEEVMNKLGNFYKKKEDTKWNMIICTTLKNFCDFVDYQLPEIESVKYVDSQLDVSISYDAQINLISKILSVNIELLKRNQNEIGAVLYHEFTHIYDYELFKKLKIEDEKAFLWYTEYHASQIEMLKKYSIANNLQSEITALSPGFLELIDGFRKKGESYNSKIELRMMGDHKFNLDIAFLYVIGVQDLIERYLGLNNRFSYICDSQRRAHEILKATKYAEFPDAQFFSRLSNAIK